MINLLLMTVWLLSVSTGWNFYLHTGFLCLLLLFVFLILFYI